MQQHFAILDITVLGAINLPERKGWFVALDTRIKLELRVHRLDAQAGSLAYQALLLATCYAPCQYFQAFR